MTATTTSITITLDDDSELARALDANPNAPITLVRGRRQFRVVRDHTALEPPAATYDPEEFRAALREVAGVFTPEQADEMIENIYRWREEGSRTPSAP
ncbi:MAG: hypothetical protein QM692_19300 [Thermomicrobiales bacterium]